MRKPALLLSLCFVACATATTPTSKAPASASAANATKNFDLANLDRSTAACTDFYQYSNGGYLAKNPIPPQYTAWGVGSILNEENRALIRDVLQTAAKNPRTPNDKKLGDYYASCLDVAAIDKAGLTPIQAELDRIAAIDDIAALQSEFAHLQDLGMSVPFLLQANTDAKDSTKVIAELYQSGLGLPDRDYYFRTDDRSKAIRDEYVKHVAKMLELSGVDATTAASNAAAIVRLETALADAAMTQVEQRDPNAIYNIRTPAQIEELAPALDWDAYFAARSVRTDRINVAQPKYITAVGRLVTETPLADWKAYLRWQLVYRNAGALPTTIEEENFRFRNAFLLGQKQQQERWQRCVARANNHLGEALGQAYVDRRFPPEAKRRATELVNNLTAALGDRIETLAWMSEPTRKQAKIKLDAFISKIGYPETWRDYSSLPIAQGPYATNWIAANAFEVRRDLNKIGKTPDRGEWYMSPQTINAYYNGTWNEIVFPAAILQWPYFDIAQDDAFNYGAIGSIIGHELTHGFDDEGSQFDENGNLRDWWTAEDRKKFEERAECIVQQFNAYEIAPGVAHNGRLVTGESIADLGGLLIAWEGWKKSLEGKPKPPVIDGFTPEQRFFLGYSRARATNATLESMRVRLATDPHPANKFRVNGPFSNFAPFAEAFGCKSGDAMVRAQSCEIW